MAALAAAFLLGGAAGRANDRIWLAASDIHLNPFDRAPYPSGYQADPNVVLFEIALAEMKRVAPDPAVVVLPGDFLMHEFAWHARWSGPSRTPDRAGLMAMRTIAVAFGRAFPNSQFVIALGNNDIPCGDYRSDAGGAYLNALARIWAPLVNRNGAAPGFVTRFPRGGYYTVELPRERLRMVVLNTVLFSNRYRGACAGDATRAGDAELTWLKSTLASPRRSVIVMHVPPGYDAFSTEFARGFLAIPFLAPRYGAQFAGLLAARADRIPFALAGHAHLFDVRLVGQVPVPILGSISPIYGNAPTFYALHLSAGSLRDIDAYSWDVATQRWGVTQSFDRNWSVAHIDARTLERIHARLASDPEMRGRWNAQAEGWRSDLGPQSGTWAQSWPIAWCAQTQLSVGFARCAGLRARLQAGRLLPLAALVVAVLLLVALIRSRRFSRR